MAAMQSFRFKVGFVGAGNMAEAICRSLVTAVFYKSSDLAASDPSEARAELFRKEYGVFICRDNSSLAEQSQTIVLAVKPQQMPEVLDRISPVVRSDQLVVSIAAGVSTAYIESKLGRQIPVIRAMPNTPMMIGAGVTALCKGAHADETHLELTKSFFASSGVVLTVEESMMDAVTAVSGSGPAYFFYLVEAMVQAGINLGLSKEDAHKLAVHTALGAAKMAIETHQEPQELRRKVTSPNGTTEAAISVLESHRVKQHFIAAIEAAAERSRQLGR